MNYTKVNVRKDIVAIIKIKAAADGRSITNYIERVLLADTRVTDMKPSDPDSNIKVNAKSPIGGQKGRI